MDLSKFGFRKDFDPNNKIVKQEEFSYQGDDYLISTVDLGLDHSFGDGPPLYYETMIFPKDSFMDLHCERYSTRSEAINGHKRILENIRSRRMVLENGQFQEIEEVKINE